MYNQGYTRDSYPLYSVNGIMIGGEWVENLAPYPITPFLQDLIMGELLLRGGTFSADLLEGGYHSPKPRGAVYQLLESALTARAADSLAQLAATAAGVMEEKGWIERDFINPHTGRRGHPVLKLTLIYEPTFYELKRIHDGRNRIMADFRPRQHSLVS